LPADGSARQVNGVDDHIDDSISSPPPTYTPTAKTTSTFDDTPIALGSLSSSNEKVIKKEETSVLSAALSHDELVQKLAEANTTIARLRKENDEGMRRRNVGSKENVASQLAPQTLQQTGQTGVPVPTVALISLFIFLLTYLLF